MPLLQHLPLCRHEYFWGVAPGAASIWPAGLRQLSSSGSAGDVSSLGKAHSQRALVRSGSNTSRPTSLHAQDYTCMPAVKGTGFSSLQSFQSAPSMHTPSHQNECKRTRFRGHIRVRMHARMPAQLSCKSSSFLPLLICSKTRSHARWPHPLILLHCILGAQQFDMCTLQVLLHSMPAACVACWAPRCMPGLAAGTCSRQAVSLSWVNKLW